MLDLKRIREAPDAVRTSLQRRGVPELAELVDVVLARDEARRARVTEVDALRSRRNELSPRVGALKKEGRDGEADALVAEVREVNARIDAVEESLRKTEAALNDLLFRIPNLPAEDVPAGGPEANRLVREWGEAPAFGFDPRPHWQIGESLGILDFPRGAKVAGSGFPLFVGAGARLERALINMMVDLHASQHGYTELWPPFLVNHEAALGTGHLPKFGEDMYAVPGDDLLLVPTAEVPVTNLHAGELLAADTLPIHYVAYTPCFRREAGAHGQETRGLIRVHQFDKVELVRFERPEQGEAALESLTSHAEEVLRRLELQYRVVLLAGGDLGFANAKTYDLEVWAPGADRWLEVSSCSHYSDFQARRAGIRFRPEQGAKPEFVHTLNGSALALARTVVALLEQHQREDGSVRIPPALAQYLGSDRLSR